MTVIKPTWSSSTTLIPPSTKTPPKVKPVGVKVVVLYNSEEYCTFRIPHVDDADKMVEWVFRNATGGFATTGMARFHFQEESDAAAFKLTFGGQ